MLTQLRTDGTVLLDTTNSAGLTTPVPSPTTLAAAITTVTQTAITVTSGAAVKNGSCIKILAEGANTEEIVLVTAGEGTANLTVTRGQMGTAPSLHANGATVNLPGGLTFKLLAISLVPNRRLIIRKTSTDINYIDVTAGIDPATAVQNLFPDGGTILRLSDSRSNGAVHLKFPGPGQNVIIPMSATGVTTSGALAQQLYWRVLLVRKCQPDTNTADNLTVQATGRGRRIAGVLRTAIGSDLVVDVLKNGTVIGTLTIPSATAVQTEVETSISTVNFTDGDILSWNITAGDNTTDAKGVAAICVEWGTPANAISTAAAWKGLWNSSTIYAIGDMVQYNGSSYTSLQNTNQNHQPDVAPTWWDLTTNGITTANQAANVVYAGPASGGAAAPGFRLLVAGDIPALPESAITGLTTDLAAKVPTSRTISTTAPMTGGGALSGNLTLAVSDMVGDSGSGGTHGLVPAPGAGDAAAGKFLKADGTFAVPSGTSSGTVTHTGGGLTADQPVFGAGSADIKVGTKSGSTNEVATVSGSLTSGHMITADGSGNLVDGGSAPGSGVGLTSVVGITIDGGGSTITTGVKGYIQIPWACTIIGWSCLADQSGSISVDIDAHSSSAPPSAPTIPNTSGDKISASAPVVLSSAQTASSAASGVSTWTTSRAQWDVIAFNVTSATTVQRVTIEITVTRA